MPPLFKKLKLKIMQQRTDDTFGEIIPKEKLLEKFIDDKKFQVETKALFFGSKDELEKIKDEVNLKKSLEKLALRQDKNEAEINNILIKLGIDDKNKILPVIRFP